MNKTIGWGIIILVAIGLGFGLTKDSVFEKKSTSGITIAENSFTFLNKTIDPEGGFYYKFDCAEKKKPCTVGEPYNPIGHSLSKMPPHFGHLILAFHDMGKKTGDTTYTEKAGLAMEYILSQCAKDEDYCLWNFSPLIVYWNETKDMRYKNAMLKVADQLSVDHTLADHLALNAGIKHKALYEITGDKKYLNLLTKNADLILAGELNQERYPVLYSANGLDVRGIVVKSIWADILPAYVVTKDAKYLAFAKAFFEKAKFSEHLGGIDVTDKLEFASYALDSLWQLSTQDASSKDIYLSEAQRIGEYIYSNFADTPDNLKFSGDYGFVENEVKDSLINGWIVRQFIRLSDLNF